MHWLDITILVVLALAALLGARSGFLGQLVRLVAVALGLYAAARLNDSASAWLEEHTPSEQLPWLPHVAAFVGVFVAVLLVGLGLAALLENGVKAAKLQGINYIFGAAFGCVKAGAVVGLLALALATYLPSASQEVLDDSSLAPFLSRGVQRGFDVFPQSLKDNVLAQLHALEDFGRSELPLAGE
jgi:uncharacterized membrane protein required for colicin V production